MPKMTEKNMEWVNPLCPKGWPYGIPKSNPLTSISGKTVQTRPRIIILNVKSLSKLKKGFTAIAKIV